MLLYYSILHAQFAHNTQSYVSFHCIRKILRCSHKWSEGHWDQLLNNCLIIFSMSRIVQQKKITIDNSRTLRMVDWKNLPSQKDYFSKSY